MDERLYEIIEKKINDTFSKNDEIKQLIHSLKELSTNSASFSWGIVIGRLYNSFYYQCRRILKRNPTEKEFFEFVSILKKYQKEFFETFS